MLKERVSLGIAPIAWTNDDMPELGGENTFCQCVSEMALAGFTGSEVGNKYPKDTRVLKKELDLRGMCISSAWFSSFFTTEPAEETVVPFIRHMDFLYAMGAKHIVVSEQGGSIQGKDVAVFGADKPIFDDAQWKKLAEGLEKVGKIAQDKGMRVVFHHHMGTGVQTSAEIDKLMEMTNPDLVSLLLDTGHLGFSGENVLEVATKHIDRIKYVHLKDIRQNVVDKVKAKGLSFLQAVVEGAFTVPGDGAIDYAPIFKLLDENNYSGWMIVEAEQDPAKANPLEYALKAKRYIDSLLQ